MKIDAVILWVDGNDETWRKEKEKYAVQSNQDSGINRYRDWGTLRYLFRGIEKYAPWIHKIFFVTCGHYPKWLNRECKKLKCINHADFIDNQYLPTFSSQAIDLNLWKIPELSNHFIYFNDDMFLTHPVSEHDFFRKGMPCDMFSERPLFPGNNIFNHNMMNNLTLLQKYYKRCEVLKGNRKKILNLKYGKIFIYNLVWYFTPYKKICGLYMNHLPMAYCKNEMRRVWERDEEEFIKTISHKFRDASDLNQFVYNMETLLSGKFFPMNMDKQGKMFSIKDENNEELYSAILCEKYKRICINDECDDLVFATVQKKITECFESILSQKSEFEK